MDIVNLCDTDYCEGLNLASGRHRPPGVKARTGTRNKKGVSAICKESFLYVRAELVIKAEVVQNP